MYGWLWIPNIYNRPCSERDNHRTRHNFKKSLKENEKLFLTQQSFKSWMVAGQGDVSVWYVCACVFIVYICNDQFKNWQTSMSCGGEGGGNTKCYIILLFHHFGWVMVLLSLLEDVRKLNCEKVKRKQKNECRACVAIECESLALIIQLVWSSRDNGSKIF